MDRLTPGQSITTEIVAITKDTIFLQLSGKSEGVLDAAELTDDEGKLSAALGDTITAYFLSAKNGELRFTTRISGETANKEMLENAWRNGIPVEGVVEKEIKGGFEIKIGSTRAFCPFSQMGERRSENAEPPVGKHLSFKIIEFKENGRNILVSNRAILDESRLEAIEDLQKTLTVGMKITGTIIDLQKFGAFVDIGGFRALLPISEISLDRIEDISSVLTVGQTIDAELLQIDWKAERVTLSMKALEDDPWKTAREKYPVDSKHTGTVVRVTDFGAFVSLEPGLDGLLHISELRGDDRSYNIKKSVTLGENFTVIVKDIDIANKRLSLKKVSSFEQDKTAQQYLDNPSENETYNPFAALLKKKK
ncbi:MAG TPA: S1 RNA-binding domain-containing protein [Treponema sp.]|nr:S1 RNA-binding domain-containing protein [Treponema sp.]